MPSNASGVIQPLALDKVLHGVRVIWAEFGTSIGMVVYDLPNVN
jgi:hypothetical protein